MDKKTRFIETIQKNEALIYKVAGFYVSNLQDREDLVQEIIYQLWKSFDSFNNKSSVTTWMYRVAMNTAIYFLKKDKRKVAVQSLEKEALEYPESEYAETEEKLKAMHSHISELNLLEKGIVMLHLEGKSYEEIGSLVGISTSNVGTRLSRIKGGGVARLLGDRPARALFISDVPGDDPAVIGSGLLGPAAGLQDRIERTVVASLDHAVEGVCVAAEKLGLDVRRPAHRFDDDAARLAVRFTHELHLNAAQVCVWGGESTVQLPPNPGRGGRNQHLALAAARLLAGQPQMLLLSAGTDGTDGVTDDAGALVDSETCARLALAEMDADDCMRRADSGTALAASGDLVHTGPTGTNVGDLVIGLKLSDAAARIVVEGRDGFDTHVL